MMGVDVLSVICDVVQFAVRATGAFFWAFMVVTVVLPRLCSRFRITPSIRLISIYKVLSSRRMLFFLFFSFAYLPISFESKYTDEIDKILLCAAYGLFIVWLLGPQGVCLPLGHGLKLTVDKAPKLEHSISDYVFSFHAGKEVLTRRKKAVKNVALNISHLRMLGLPYDVVFHSWIFGSHGSKNDAVKEFKFSMRNINVLFCMFLAGLVVPLALEYYVEIFHGSPILRSIAFLIVASITLVSVIGMVLSFCYAMYIRSGFKIDDEIPGSTPIAEFMMQYLKKQIHECQISVIKPTLLSRKYLAAMSITCSAAFNTTNGQQAGFVLYHKGYAPDDCPSK